MTNFFIRCPFCESQDIEPREAVWLCNNCNRVFSEAPAAILEETDDAKRS